jgi:DoxX-like family
MDSESVPEEVFEVVTACFAITAALALMAVFSGIGKIRHDARQVATVHETVGVPLKYFPYLAACEFAGAAGLAIGIWWPVLGVAAAAGLVLYFLGAVVSHLRVGDVKGIGPAAFMLTLAAGALVLRVLTWRAG